MTSDTLTRTRTLGVEHGDYIVRTASTAASSEAFPDRDTTTWSLSRMTRNAMMPLLFGLASLAAPVVPVRRVFSGAAISRSAFASDLWLFEDEGWYLTEEYADAAEVRALNALLHLPAATGPELDLPE